MDGRRWAIREEDAAAALTGGPGAPMAPRLVISMLLASIVSAHCAHAGASRPGGVDVFDAAERGDAASVSRYLAAGGAVDARDDALGDTPLMTAAQRGHAAVARALIEAGAGVDLKSSTGGWTALMYAVHFGREEVAKALIAAGADVDAEDEGEPPASVLMHAAMSGHAELGFLLKAAGAKVDIFAAAAMGDAEFVSDYLRAGGDVNVRHRPGGWIPVANAAQYGHGAVVRLLVDAGADVNAVDNSGFTALRWASVAGRAEMVALLKRSGAKDLRVNWSAARIFSAPFLFDAPFVDDYLARGGDADLRNEDGQTPLMMAALVHAPIVKALIRAGADVNARDAEGWTALMSAALRGETEALRLLLGAGADADARDAHGWTALMRAAEEGHLDAVRLLLAARADLDATNVLGQTALARAALYRRADVVSVLTQARPRASTAAPPR